MPITKFNKSITQLTATGTSDWIDLSSLPNDLTFDLTWVNAGSAVVNFDYSDDASTVASISESTASLTDAGTVVLSYPVSVAYRYIRINWTGGTATSLDAVARGSLIN